MRGAHLMTSNVSGAVPIFIRLLLSANEDVREQSAWALGNVAGDSVECRDMVLGMGALPALLHVSQVSSCQVCQNCCESGIGRVSVILLDFQRSGMQHGLYQICVEVGC